MIRSDPGNDHTVTQRHFDSAALLSIEPSGRHTSSRQGVQTNSGRKMDSGPRSCVTRGPTPEKFTSP